MYTYIFKEQDDCSVKCELFLTNDMNELKELIKERYTPDEDDEDICSIFEDIADLTQENI